MRQLSFSSMARKLKSHTSQQTISRCFSVLVILSLLIPNAIRPTTVQAATQESAAAQEPIEALQMTKITEQTAGIIKAPEPYSQESIQRKDSRSINPIIEDDIPSLTIEESPQRKKHSWTVKSQQDITDTEEVSLPPAGVILHCTSVSIGECPADGQSMTAFGSGRLHGDKWENPFNIKVRLICDPGVQCPTHIYAQMGYTFSWHWGWYDNVPFTNGFLVAETNKISGIIRQETYCGNNKSGSCWGYTSVVFEPDQMIYDESHPWTVSYTMGAKDIPLNPTFFDGTLIYFVIVRTSPAPQVPDNTSYSLICQTGNPLECPFARNYTNSRDFEGDPIDTENGGFSESFDDLSISTSAGPLSFIRTYSSKATEVYTRPLGSGWSHNQDIRLILPDDPGGHEGQVWLKAQSGNQYVFLYDSQIQKYIPYPGLLASLEQTNDQYIFTDSQQNIYSFDLQGKLLTRTDSKGNAWHYTYESDRLTKVSDETGDRYLEFAYNAQENLASVADQSGRQVSFIYDTNSNELISATDVLTQTWIYQYDQSPEKPPHLLTDIIDPRGIEKVHTEYDTQGRAIAQSDGNDQQRIRLEYNQELTTTVIDGNNISKTLLYDGSHTLIGEIDPLNSSRSIFYDQNLNPVFMANGDQVPTTIFWSNNGVNPVQVIDQVGNTTQMTYDENNNLTSVLDPLGHLSAFDYTGTLLIRSTDAISHTTIYTYTTSADAPQPPGLLKSVEDPSGQITSYTYNLYGERTSVSQGPGRVATYSYDSLGRLIKVTDPTGISNWTCYDPAGRIIRTVANASGDGNTPATNPCDAEHYISSGLSGYDRIGAALYGAVGNVKATIDPEGLITRSYYDNANQLVAVVRNLVNWDMNNPDLPPTNLRTAEQNITTQTYYDYNRNVIASIDPLGRITRTYYDALNRPIFTTENLANWEIFENTPPPVGLRTDSENVTTQTVYDAFSRVIANIDPLGRISRTYYDILNRPVTIVQNLVVLDGSGNPLPADLAIAQTTPPNRDATHPERNLRTDNTYDANGNTIATTDPAGRIMRTYFDDLNQPQYIVQNLMGQSIDLETPPVYDPAFPDRNVKSQTVYDNAGKAIATIDAMGKVTRTYYDPLNQPYMTVQNLIGQAIDSPNPPNYDPQYPDQNIRRESIYDTNGRSIASIDPLGMATRTYYDSLNRPYLVAQNLEGQPVENNTPPSYNPANPDENILAETIYDAGGHTIANIDTSGRITRNYYDSLGRTTAVVSNLEGQSVYSNTIPAYDPAFPDRNVRTERYYDAAGNIIRTSHPTGQVTSTCYDGLNRAVKTIVTPTTTDPCSSYTPSSEPDQDIISIVEYDAAGNQVAVTDPNDKRNTYQYDGLNRLVLMTDPLQHQTGYSYDPSGNRTAITDAKNVVTRYEYDALNRLTAVVENYISGASVTNERNVRTEYTYDAVGNRLSIKDGSGHLTRFTYDALYRLTSEKDPLEHQTTYIYDAAGNQTGLLDANGYTTHFIYDGVYRLLTIDYPGADVDVYYEYNGTGQRVEMHDEAGSTTWTYDDLYRPLVITDPFTGTVRYEYDAPGNRTLLEYPDLKQVTYTYDDAGRLIEVTDWDSEITHYTYDKAGNMTYTDLPNGILSQYSYDDAGRLISLTHTATETLSSFQYTYDEIGNRTGVTETLRKLESSADLIFKDDFDRGDLSGWHSSQTDAGDLRASASAAMGGSSGLLADIDDENPIFVTDWSPLAEIRYRARFYFDPHSLSMLNGDTHYIFQAYDNTTREITRIELRSYQGDYQVRAGLINDSNGWTFTPPWSTIRDQIHYLEIDWRAATAAGANNGGITFWIDGVQVANLTNIDNDTRRVDYIKLGAVLYLDPGTRGAYYFDSFESHRQSYIGQDPNIPPAPPPAPPDPVFSDGYEAGNLSAWSASATDNGDLMVSASAAITGSYGLQADLDDNNSIYVTDWNPYSEAHYRARYYFDPNNLVMASNDSFYLFLVSDWNNNLAARIEFRFMVGDYQIRAEAQNDVGGWSSTPWLTITDGPHALELEWKAATAQGANNGILNFWVDGIQQGNFANIDNDTRRVDLAQIGAVSGIDNGTRGTVYFDGFASRRETYIGLDPTAPPAPPFPEKTDALFADGFEAGNLSAWSASTTDNGHLSVSALGAITGSYGLQASINDNNNLYVTDWTPYEESEYRARFFFDPNSISMSNGDAHFLFYALNRGGTLMLRIELQRSSATYQVRASTYNDVNAWIYTGWSAIGDASHSLEVDWKAATASGANNGVLSFWVDGTRQGNFTNLDNDTRKIEYAQLGVVSGIDSGTRGSEYFDAFVSRRSSYIGPLSLIRMPLLDPEQAPPQGAAPEISGATPSITYTETITPTEVVTNAEEQPAGEGFEILTVVATDMQSITSTVVLPPVTYGSLQEGNAAASVTAEPGGSEALEVLFGDPAPTYLTTVIHYTYDPLSRLTRADYDDGTYLDYSYDAVGNRLTEGSTGGVTTSYTYDSANRMTSAGGITYTWDANGNLLNDGTYNYTYDHANRLKAVSGLQLAMSYKYNGMGDRIEQMVNGATTRFTLDLNTGLTQVLLDGTDTYLYGVGRIAQQQGGQKEYFLTDALGSVRQLADNTSITLNESYQPYGELLSSEGSSSSIYGFTGEIMDSSGLLYLRSRYYAPTIGRFLTRDTWQGDTNKPMSYNAWLYTYANPINLTDPSGKCPDNDGDGKCDPGWWCDRLSGEARERCQEIAWSCTSRNITPEPLPNTPPPGDIVNINSWITTISRYERIRKWLQINDKSGITVSKYDRYGLRLVDNYLISFIISSEFHIYMKSNIKINLLTAVYNQYKSAYLCNGSCDTTMKQLIWLSNMQGWYGGNKTDQDLLRLYGLYTNTGLDIIGGIYHQGEDFWWANYTGESELYKCIHERGKCKEWFGEEGAYTVYSEEFPDQGYAGLAVFTALQSLSCRRNRCTGW